MLASGFSQIQPEKLKSSFVTTDLPNLTSSLGLSLIHIVYPWTQHYCSWQGTIQLAGESAGTTLGTHALTRGFGESFSDITKDDSSSQAGPILVKSSGLSSRPLSITTGNNISGIYHSLLRTCFDSTQVLVVHIKESKLTAPSCSRAETVAHHSSFESFPRMDLGGSMEESIWCALFYHYSLVVLDSHCSCLLGGMIHVQIFGKHPIFWMNCLRNDLRFILIDRDWSWRLKCTNNHFI